ncbi:MAG: 3-hydroxyacyl-CoA dehydrogenase family protein [Gemmatimonadales bacterium]
MTTERTGRVAILGGGIMGSGVAAIFLRGGRDVHVTTPSAGTRSSLPTRARAAMEAIPRRDAAEVPPAGALAVHETLDTVPWPEIDLVVECVTEDLALKQALFAQVERLARPDVPLVSNTSGLSIGAIGGALATRSRVAGLHFFMPAHLVPLVEVVCAPFTSPEIADALVSTMRALGKVPIRVARDIPGFVGNRLQHAVMREALWLVEDGVASPEDIDAAVRFGFGFRYLACGPLLQKELSGWDVHLRAAASIYPSLHNEPAPPPSLGAMVADGHIGMKTMEGLWRWTPETAAAERARIETCLRTGLDLLLSDPA